MSGSSPGNVSGAWVQGEPSNNWTFTTAPPSIRLTPPGSTMKQFTSDIERSTPEPWAPVGTTFQPSPPRCRLARIIRGGPAACRIWPVHSASSRGRSGRVSRP